MPLLPYQSIIASPVGKGQKSAPRDVMSLRESLQRLKRYQGDIKKEYMDADLEKALQQFQKDEGLQTDGVMYPSGETERALNRNLAGERNPFADMPDAKIDLSKSVGSGRSNKAGDVKQVQKALALVGHLPPSLGFEANGILDERLESSIRSFQKKNDLRVDGKLKPGGETEKALNIAIRQEISDIEKEPLPPLEPQVRTIPGTNIPDESVPEGMVIRKEPPYDTDPNIIISPPLPLPRGGGIGGGGFSEGGGNQNRLPGGWFGGGNGRFGQGGFNT